MGMSDEMKRPGSWPWVVAVLIGLPVLYVATFGPAVWSTARGHLDRPIVERAYWPLLWTIVYGPEAASTPLKWWASLAIPPGDWADFHVDDSGSGFVCFFRR